MSKEPFFKSFPKIPRLSNETFTISEKVDGSNGLIFIRIDPGYSSVMVAGSRSRWLYNDGTETWDNFGFGRWVRDNKDSLWGLGAGYHFGEWYGQGINRNYGLKDRKFMLFDAKRYQGMHVFPEIVQMERVFAANVSFDILMYTIDHVINDLYRDGSSIVRGYMKPEGIIVRSDLTNKVYKVLI